jgi:hypothetical protein
MASVVGVAAGKARDLSSNAAPKAAEAKWMYLCFLICLSCGVERKIRSFHFRR